MKDFFGRKVKSTQKKMDDIEPDFIPVQSPLNMILEELRLMNEKLDAIMDCIHT